VITNRVQQLENFVQAPLFHRSTRAVMLSEAGSYFLKECVELVSHLDSVVDSMRVMKTTPTGVLRLQVLPGFALGHLGSALKDFSTAYPSIDLDIIVSDVAVNPVDKGYDVALQIFRPGAETLIERPLFRVRRVFCASPDYINRHGSPEKPEDLLTHRLGLYSSYPTRNKWTFKKGDAEITLELPAKIRSNSVHLLRDFALSAGGITCLPTLVCGDDLLTGRLVPILADYELPSFKLVAIYPVTHRRALKVKLFVEFITARFSGEPEWDRALSSIVPKLTDADSLSDIDPTPEPHPQPLAADPDDNSKPEL
jgi:DNA-binding transcriptional LysR family regulator